MAMAPTVKRSMPLKSDFRGADRDTPLLERVWRDHVERLDGSRLIIPAKRLIGRPTDIQCTNFDIAAGAAGQASIASGAGDKSASLTLDDG